MRAKKGECSKTQRNKNKNENFFLKRKNKTKRKDKHAKTNKAVKVPNKRVKIQTMQKFQIRVLERGHTQRKHKKEKENTCGRNEKTRREKRDNR